MFRFFLVPSLHFVAPQFIYVFANGLPARDGRPLSCFSVIMIIYLYTSIILFQSAPPAWMRPIWPFVMCCCFFVTMLSPKPLLIRTWINHFNFPFICAKKLAFRANKLCALQSLLFFQRHLHSDVPRSFFSLSIRIKKTWILSTVFLPFMFPRINSIKVLIMPRCARPHLMENES